MSLWDALSGKVYRWNQAKINGHELVRVELRRFYMEAHKYPESAGPFFKRLVETLYSFHFAAEIVFNRLVEDETFRNLLFSLNENTFRTLVSIMHASETVQSCHDKDIAHVLVMSLQGIGFMYDRPNSFLNAWKGRAEKFQDVAANGPMLVTLSRYEEIATLLGLPTYKMEGVLLWGDVSNEIAVVSNQINMRADWPDIAKAELKY